MSMDHASLASSALHDLLRQGLAGGATVVTANRRLARSLHRSFDAAQAALGLACWETADVLPFDAFVERAWDDALGAPAGALRAVLMTPAQELALWEEAIGDSGEGLLSRSAAAAQCREAWDLVHAWDLQGKLRGAPAGEDARAFAQWGARYERLTRERGLADGARLPLLAAPLLGEAAVRKPRLLVLHGFDLFTPRQSAFLAALRACGVEVRASSTGSRGARPVRCELPRPEAELDAAAQWARARLQANPAARIGIVVPDLARLRSKAARALSRVLHPGQAWSADDGAVMAFDLSLGVALDELALVREAMMLLRLCGREVPFEDASRILRSPHLAGADSELGARAQLDARLRRHAGADVTLDSLARFAADGPPRLRGILEALARHRRESLFGTKLASEWARAFADALRLAGFPGERPLDSSQFQALRKWHEVLASLATLDRVCGRMGHAQACGRLERLARDTLFQPESEDVPIQVLGVLESVGLEFDHLWVTGLTADAWPMPPRPNPFVPIALQRGAGVPHADAASSLALDRRITAGWEACAAEVVFSHARLSGDSELLASPLIEALPAATLEALGVAPVPTLRDAMRARGQVERVADGRAAALAPGPRGGGTGLFRDQAACPFRAFALHRVGAKRPEAPQTGLDARDRGTVLHEMMRGVWSRLRTRARLESIGEAELSRALGESADEAIAVMTRKRPDVMTGAFAAMERERLLSLAREWLEVELTRADFEVLETEQKRAVTFGGVTVNAKLDRMDALSQGGRAVIDYKTGEAAPTAWLGPRPEEPQLPMYALTGGEDVRATAFAKLKRPRLGFAGLAMEEGLLPGVRTLAKNKSDLARTYRDWSDLVARWRVELDGLGASFLAGDARVDPKKVEVTCKHCEQHAFCRIAEKQPDAFAPEDDDEVEAE